MKTYTILYAEEVPHYGLVDIEAPDDDAAIEIAKQRSVGSVAIDPDYENAVLKRIVHIEDEAGNIVAHDIALDNCFLRYGGKAEERLLDIASTLLEALHAIAAIPLWGEELPASMLSIKQDLIEQHEFDVESQTYEPCADAESSYLQHAVETARAALAEIEGGSP